VEICHTDFRKFRLEELTMVFFFITTLQLLMCLWQKENRWVSPTGDATRVLDLWSRSLVSVVSLAPFLLFVGIAPTCTIIQK
jgi:hypothetical protein